MSIIKSIKQVLGISGTASENHFWDGSVPNQLSLKRGTPEASGAELIKALNGVLSFPNQGQSLTAKGYVKLPGGLIVQWLTVPGSGTDSGFVFALPFPTAVLGVVATPVSAQPAGGVALTCSLRSVTTSGGITQARYVDAAQVIPSSADIYIIAVGH